MIFRMLDADHDWTFGKGLGNYASGSQAIAANIQTRVLSWTNDCFFALQDGVDWRSRLEKGQLKNLELEIKRVIFGAEGVVGVRQVQVVLDPSTRRCSIGYTVQTIFSQAFRGRIEQTAGAGS